MWVPLSGCERAAELKSAAQSAAPGLIIRGSVGGGCFMFLALKDLPVLFSGGGCLRVAGTEGVFENLQGCFQ